jgi:hypothetical protein
MDPATSPNQLIGELALGGWGLVAFWRLIVWVRESPVSPDPWDAETEQKLSEPDAVQVCHHCFTEQRDNGWFCPCCGSAVGQCNNVMPYLNLFSQGEVLRNGVTDRIRLSPFIIFGYLLFSLTAYAVFAPVYWFHLFKNIQRLEKAGPLRDETS